MDALAGRFTLVLVDGRGRGRSGKPHDPAAYAAQHLAADILAVLDDLGVDRAGFWGQSLGGRVGLVLAIRHHGRLGALVVGATRAQAVTVDPATIEPRPVPTLVLAGDHDPAWQTCAPPRAASPALAWRCCPAAGTWIPLPAATSPSRSWCRS